MTPLLCACAVVITLETQKCQKRAPRSVKFNFFLIAIDRNGFRRMKEEGQIYKCCLRFFNFCRGIITKIIAKVIGRFAKRISVRFSERSSWDFDRYGNYGIEGYNACKYRKCRTGRNLTRTFPKIVPKFVLQTSLMIVQSLVMILPHFFDFERP